MTEEVELLKDISRKLSQLIMLTKLLNYAVIRDVKKEIGEDEVSRRILELADGSLGSAQLKQEVKTLTNVSDSTIERRITLLVEKGALASSRRGREVYYENYGLYD